MQAAAFIVNTGVASANAWKDGITHKWNVVMCNKKQTAHILETLEMIVGHRGCCHDDSREREPMAALLSSSAFWLALWQFTQLITERILPTCVVTQTHKHTHTHTHTHADMHSWTHSHRQPAVTLRNTVCVSVSLSGLIINNAWLWEDERLFWLEACVLYGERDISTSSFNCTSIDEVKTPSHGCPQ